MPTGAAALAKGLYLLDVIGEQPTPPRFHDLQAATGLSKGTLARMLDTLVLFRFVRHEDSDNTYRLGHRLFELAHRVWEAFDCAAPRRPCSIASPTRCAKPSRCARSRTTRCSTSTSAAAAARSDSASRSAAARRSTARPAARRSSPSYRRTNSARSSTACVSTLHGPHPQPTRTRSSADLALAKARGYAISLGERVAGVSSVAAPIFDHTRPRRRRDRRLRAELAPLERPPARRRARSHGGGAANLRQCRRGADEHHLVGAARGAMRIRGSMRAAAGRASRRRAGLVARGAAALLGRYPGALRAPLRPRDRTQRGAAPAAAGQRRGAAAQRRARRADAGGPGGVRFRERRAWRPSSIPRPTSSDNRFNDGKCDRAGRLWAGSMSLDASRPTGALYAIAGDLTSRSADIGFTVANGLDWSPDGRTFYFAEFGAGPDLRLRFRRRDGHVGGRRVFAEVPAGGGAAGRAGGRCRQASSGARSGTAGACAATLRTGGSCARSSSPVPRPTASPSAARISRTLFITSARIRLPSRILAEAPFSGGLFALPVDVPGLPPTEFAG